MPLVCASGERLPANERASHPPSFCVRPLAPEWRKAPPCWNTSDCLPGRACFGTMVFDCEGRDVGCKERLSGRCLPDGGSHKQCRGPRDCAQGEDCGDAALLACPAGPNSCEISVLGEVYAFGRKWKASQSVCVTHGPKRFVVFF